MHRDVKLGNIWHTADGDARLGDFGVALTTEATPLTRDGAMVGTATYLSPEQALGGGSPLARTPPPIPRPRYRSQSNPLIIIPVARRRR